VNLGNACCHLVQNHLLCSLLPKHVKIKIYTTITLNVVLYGCKTWSLIRRNRLRVSEVSVLRIICRTKREA